MSFTIAQIQRAVAFNQVIWKKHTLQRLSERRIKQQDALQVLTNGEVIKTYLDDKPFPSALVIGYVGSRPIHVVASFGEEMVHIITVYEPSLDIFESDLKLESNEISGLSCMWGFKRRWLHDVQC